MEYELLNSYSHTLFNNMPRGLEEFLTKMFDLGSFCGFIFLKSALICSSRNRGEKRVGI